MNPIEELKQAILRDRKAGSLYVNGVPTSVTSPDGRKWKGVVEVFLLVAHPTAKTVYAWKQLPLRDGEKIRLITMPHIGGVNCPEAAVKEAIRLGL
jgi:hypothetical protein